MNNLKGSELQKALETLGLTEYEAKAYISLVQKGTSNAGNLSKLAEIPHSKIYEVLTRLEKKKLVEVQTGRPLFFKAIKPSLAIKGVRTELESLIEQELSERRKTLENNYSKKILQMSNAQTVLEELDNYFELKGTSEPSEEFVWTIHGKNNLNNQAKEIILSALHDLRVMAPLDDFSEFEASIKTVNSKSVRVQLVIHNITPSVERLKDITEIFYENAPLPTNCGMILADEKKGMFISENCNVGFKTSSPSVLMLLAQFYEHEVEESTKIKL